jgi:hypothetical protein
LRPEEASQPTLGKTEAVERRGVEVADAQRPGPLDRRFRLVIADRHEQAAQRRGAEPDARDFQRGAAEPTAQEIAGHRRTHRQMTSR